MRLVESTNLLHVKPETENSRKVSRVLQRSKVSFLFWDVKVKTQRQGSATSGASGTRFVSKKYARSFQKEDLKRKSSCYGSPNIIGLCSNMQTSESLLFADT
jgi:hypothetical protein